MTMRMIATLRDQIETALRAGERPAAIAARLVLDYDREHAVVVLPGWRADDGNAEVEYPEASAAGEAAEEYVSDSDWGEIESTTWIDVWAWRVGLRLDEDGEVEAIEIDREEVTVSRDPEEPECSSGEGHDWQAPHEIVGGLVENPGVWGSRGGVRTQEVCLRCGCMREIDTGGERPDTGERATVVRYEPDWLSARAEDR